MKITKVADMTGIEHFTNLHELIACNNQIATLDLSGMTKLEKLDMSGCGKLQSLKLAGCSGAHDSSTPRAARSRRSTSRAAAR